MSFSKTIGHEKQKALFLQVLKSDRCAHAYVLSGQEHIGKTTFAIELGSELGADPMWDLWVADSVVPGLTIDEARNLQKWLSLSPVGKHKVAVIASADAMTNDAGNCLLKVLEEPPPSCVILFTTANFYKLLPTLASRAQRVNFGKASDEEVKQALREFALPDQENSRILEFAAGRIGVARKIAFSKEFAQFFQDCENQYKVLESGSVTDRLLASEKAVPLKSAELREFLIFAMRQWTKKTSPAGLAEKLKTAWRDLEFNLNIKLVMDNLFLP